MIVLYIILAFLLALTVVLFLPLGVDLQFKDQFLYKVKFVGIILYPRPNKSKIEPKEDKSDKKTQDNADSFFENLRKKIGFVGALKEIFGFFADCFVPFKRFLNFVKFKNVNFNLSVAGSDSAMTAIEYGAVCSVVYPVLSLFKSLANVKYKKIDIKSDFEGKKSVFSFSLKLRVPLVFVLIFGFRIFKEYKKFSVRNGL